MLAGNHSFDVDIHTEENYIKFLKPSFFYEPKKGIAIEKQTFGDKTKANYVFTYTPKFIKIKSQKNFQIEFLDFNPSIIECLTERNEADYFKCEKNPSMLSYQEALDYAGRVFQAFAKFTKVNKDENLRIWKVVRSHQPPFNSEDSDKRANFFFKKIEANYYKNNFNHKKENFNNEDFDINNVSKIEFAIFDLLKANNINIYLASHIHVSQVLAYPYS